MLGGRKYGNLWCIFCVVLFLIKKNIDCLLKSWSTQQEVKKVVHASADAEEFPSLGGATRRLGANFVKEQIYSYV